MGKGCDFPAVTALGLYDRAAEHVRYETAGAAPAESSTGDAEGGIPPPLDQDTPAAPAYRRSLFRR
jgi:hypothetical protein